MEFKEKVTAMRDFLDEEYNQKLLDTTRNEKMHVVVDFKKLMNFNPELAEYILDEAEEALDAFSSAAREVCEDLPKDFIVRLSGVEKHNKILINKIRSKHIGKFLTVEGMIKQKSDVRAQITSAKFECPVCSNTVNIFQLDENKFREPKECSCGRKGKFKLLSKEKLDVFSLALEEPTELITGGTKLSKIRVLCKGGLTRPQIERTLYQGIRAEITGILQEFQIRGRSGNLTAKVDWYIDANFVKPHDENFTNIKWNKNDVQEFEELSQRKDWLAALRKSIFYDIHGYHEECEGIILQMFGGVGMNREGLRIRGNVHILLVGDPGNAKSTMLKISQRFSPKSMYVAGTGVSGPGLTASVVRDELLGGFSLEAGTMVLCNNGTVMLDEFDKVGDEHKKSLHEVLEQELVSIAKANIQATLIARTSLLAAANPKHGSYSDFDSVYSQIDLAPTLINRFDLVYPIKESKLKEDDDYDIALKILGRAGSESEQEFCREFVKKYVAYAKTINPVMPLGIQKFIAKKYQELKILKRKMNERGKQSLPISGRNVDGFRRVIEAVARSRLHDEVSEDDACIGYEKVLYSVRQVGIDPDSGEEVQEFSVGKPIKKKDLVARILSLVRDRSGAGKTLAMEELITILHSEGVEDRIKIEEIVEILKKNADIFEPRAGQLSSV